MLVLLRHSSGSRTVNAKLRQQLEGEKWYWREIPIRVVTVIQFYAKEGCTSMVKMNYLDLHTMVTFLAFWKSSLSLILPLLGT